METVATSLSSIWPRAQEMVLPVREHAPREEVIETKLTTPCTWFVKLTLLAVEGPPFVTATVNVRLLPTATAFTELTATATSATGVTVAELSSNSPSAAGPWKETPALVEKRSRA